MSWMQFIGLAVYTFVVCFMAYGFGHDAGLQQGREESRKKPK